jgi:SHAQKYF class myb-like DNA-binding protein
MNDQAKKQKQTRYWTKSEHELFLEALEKYGPKNVKSISEYVGTRTPTQVRTHAQKYFLRLKRIKDDELSDSLSNSPQKDISLSLNDAPSEPVVISKRATLICKRDNNLPTRSSTPPPQFTAFYRSPTHISSHSNPSSPVSSAILLSLSDNIESRSPYARTTNDIQQEDFSNDDKFKLRYAMRVYKHIKDENTKINCIQRHFFPNVSLDELKEKLNKYTDYILGNNNNDSLQTPYQGNPLQSHPLDSPFDHSYKDDSQDLFEDTLTNNFKTSIDLDEESLTLSDPLISKKLRTK